MVALALPIFLLAGWDSRRLGARRGALGRARRLVGLVLARLPLGTDKLAASSVVGIGMMFRPVAVMVVARRGRRLGRELGIAAALVYALAYTLELGVSLARYFGGRSTR